MGLTHSGGVVARNSEHVTFGDYLFKMFYQNTWFCHHQKWGDCKNKNCVCKLSLGFDDNNGVFVKELF